MPSSRNTCFNLCSLLWQLEHRDRPVRMQVAAIALFPYFYPLAATECHDPEDTQSFLFRLPARSEEWSFPWLRSDRLRVGSFHLQNSRCGSYRMEKNVNGSRSVHIWFIEHHHELCWYSCQASGWRVYEDPWIRRSGIAITIIIAVHHPVQVVPASHPDIEFTGQQHL